MLNSNDTPCPACGVAHGSDLCACRACGHHNAIIAGACRDCGTPAPVATPAWYTRGGSFFAGRVYDVDAAKGTARADVQEDCTRCGGQGGWQGWPGFTCYRCGGNCHEPLRTIRVYRADALARVDAAADKRKATADAKRAREQAAALNARRPGFDAWAADHADTLAHIRAGAPGNDFLADLARRLDQCRELSERQLAAADAAVARDAKRTADRARTAASVHVGTPGERRAFRLTVVKAIARESQWGVTHTVLLDDALGNRLIYFGNALPGDGVTFTCMAAVKEHSEREGVKQTVIARPTKVVTVGDAPGTDGNGPSADHVPQGLLETH